MISRIFRGENENAAVKRKRQIDTLKIFNDNVLELREDVEYQVQFDAGERRMAITVSLSPEFPLEKPVLRVSPTIIHPWCNEYSEITSAPGLLNFTVHSDLGRVVQAIIREFSKNPPRLVEDNAISSLSQGGMHFHAPLPNGNYYQKFSDLHGRASPSYALQPHSTEQPSTSYNSYYNSHYPQFSTPNTSTNAYNYNYTSTGSGSQHSTFIDGSRSGILHNSTPQQYSSSQHTSAYSNMHYVNANLAPQNRSQTPVAKNLEFPELENLTNEELKSLIDDDVKLDEFLEKNSQLKDLDGCIEDAIDSVEKIAKENLAKEQDLKQLQEYVAEKVQIMEGLKPKYEQLVQKYDKLSEVFTPSHIRECLKQAADESHEQSETIAQDFLNRKIDVERFLSTYVECRKLGQARRTKEEKLAHQLNELKRAGF